MRTEVRHSYREPLRPTPLSEALVIRRQEGVHDTRLRFQGVAIDSSRAGNPPYRALQIVWAIASPDRSTSIEAGRTRFAERRRGLGHSPESLRFANANLDSRVLFVIPNRLP
jgi:hypothetical protein